MWMGGGRAHARTIYTRRKVFYVGHGRICYYGVKPTGRVYIIVARTALSIYIYIYKIVTRSRATLKRRRIDITTTITTGGGGSSGPLVRY